LYQKDGGGGARLGSRAPRSGAAGAEVEIAKCFPLRPASAFCRPRPVRFAIAGSPIAGIAYVWIVL
jgi:hypothetical protein